MMARDHALMRKEQAATEDQQKPLQGLRILVAEDNVLAAMELEQVLEDCGCETVGPAATVDQALRLARDEALDGAVLDVNLRDRAVFPVADELARRGIRMIFATGYESNYTFPEHLDGYARLRKPYPGQELRRLMTATFTGNQARRALPPPRAAGIRKCSSS
jgi:CheY-like chemotaxis protein